LLEVSVVTVPAIRNNSRPSVLRDPQINSLDSELSPLRQQHLYPPDAEWAYSGGDDGDNWKTNV